jgi:hypothetical protein
LTHEAGITAPIFSYQASLTEAFASQTLGHDPARVRNDFEDVLETVTREYRAVIVIVIDDTDHFAASGAGGELDEQAIANLYHHGVRTLAEFDKLDVLVAIQPQFRQVELVGEVETRFNFRHIDVATLPSGHDDFGLSHVLARRLTRAHVEASVDDLIEPSALAQLQGAYFVVDHDLRRVLQFADEAARLAADDGATRIAPRHVQRALEGY